MESRPLIGIWFSFVVLRGFLPRPRRKWGESTRIIIFFRTCLHRCTMANSDTIFRIRSQFSPSVRGCWIYSEPDCRRSGSFSPKQKVSFPSGPHQKNLVVSSCLIKSHFLCPCLSLLTLFCPPNSTAAVHTSSE
jgi:hypothetical protein